VDAVYLGDFDSKFSTEYFWDNRDKGLAQWSVDAVVRGAVLLARALHSLALAPSNPEGVGADPMPVDQQVRTWAPCMRRVRQHPRASRHWYAAPAHLC
jgi:hypothetical protein